MQCDPTKADTAEDCSEQVEQSQCDGQARQNGTGYEHEVGILSVGITVRREGAGLRREINPPGNWFAPFK